ncbi:(d)CMP kinase [Halalkalibacter nanhaiisediminis]|uniref:Cytidylate kinase n=1 Tax=Halalkalibacter nanhaiisediminis TaxID=688079 RepID=A0A562QRW6_9BACI|nr:(d)CMP kinase [Halalkalibacter nanhaiisediminis]TWI58836.1 cytidylate kinase [Halalkalibacter nanhaiisediminis]
MNNKMQIAIDGPAGAGKSTVAKLVAEKLSFLYIDTGAMYRALTYAALQRKVNLQDGNLLKELLDTIVIRLAHTQNGFQVFLNDEDVTEQIRSADVTSNVSLVSSHEPVRLEMVERQRQLAENGRTVLDGRDIGTYVLPDAEVKIFLTASVDERAKRRHEELLAKGIASDFDQLKKDIAHRDQLDSTRAFAPLKKASDAVEIDSTTLSIQDVVLAIIDIVKERAR